MKREFEARELLKNSDTSNHNTQKPKESFRRVAFYLNPFFPINSKDFGEINDETFLGLIKEHPFLTKFHNLFHKSIRCTSESGNIYFTLLFDHSQLFDDSIYFKLNEPIARRSDIRINNTFFKIRMEPYDDATFNDAKKVFEYWVGGWNQYANAWAMTNVLYNRKIKTSWISNPLDQKTGYKCDYLFVKLMTEDDNRRFLEYTSKKPKHQGKELVVRQSTKMQEFLKSSAQVSSKKLKEQ